MIQPILPVFYTSVLGLNKEFIGLIEGSLTTIVSLMKIGAGYLSDALGVRKIYEFAHGFYHKKKGNSIFLRAGRQAGGGRTFKLIEGEPLQTSFGEDLYHKVFHPTG